MTFSDEFNKAIESKHNKVEYINNKNKDECKKKFGIRKINPI